MMAFDRTPSSPDLDPAITDALRATLARSITQGNHQDDLHDVLCKAAEQARERGIQAERLLIILKDIWFSLPELASAPSRDIENKLLQELISRCIQEYYSL
jgi:hypothetical protein